jgi:hypothetical protein
MSRAHYDRAGWLLVAVVMLGAFFSGIVHIPRTPPLTDEALQKRSAMGACMMNVDPLRMGCDWNQARAWDDPREVAVRGGPVD